MAERGMFATTDLVPLLAERGVVLSREQVYRLVVGTPERLSLRILAALCDILGCGPGDLVEPVAERQPDSRRTAGDVMAPPPSAALSRPKRARITPDAQDGR